MQLDAQLADVRALRAAPAMQYCNHLLSPSMMPDFQDISSPQPMFIWTS